MGSIKIKVFEWLLPSNSNEADATVVEIDVPRLVTLWWDTTWELVTEVFGEQGKGTDESLYFCRGSQWVEMVSPL